MARKREMEAKAHRFPSNRTRFIPRSWFEVAAAAAFDMTAKADVCCHGNVLKKALSCACITLDRSLRFPRWRTAASPLTARSFYRAADPDG